MSESDFLSVCPETTKKKKENYDIRAPPVPGNVCFIETKQTLAVFTKHQTIHKTPPFGYTFFGKVFVLQGSVENGKNDVLIVSVKQFTKPPFG